jgi:hypothetical protein
MPLMGQGRDGMNLLGPPQSGPQCLRDLTDLMRAENVPGSANFCREHGSNVRGQNRDCNRLPGRLGEYWGGHIGNERLGGFQVDDELELSPPQYRQVRSVLALTRVRPMSAAHDRF